MFDELLAELQRVTSLLETLQQVQEKQAQAWRSGWPSPNGFYWARSIIELDETPLLIEVRGAGFRNVTQEIWWARDSFYYLWNGPLVPPPTSQEGNA